ncbi:hypothetical protein NN561_008801 [Cricetulus griseus]
MESPSCPTPGWQRDAGFIRFAQAQEASAGHAGRWACQVAPEPPATTAGPWAPRLHPRGGSRGDRSLINGQQGVSSTACVAQSLSAST